MKKTTKDSLIKEFEKFRNPAIKPPHLIDDDWDIIKQFLSKALDTIEKETKEKMAKALRMKEIKWQLEENYSDVIYESYNDAVEVFNKAIESYLKENI